jgi:mono/diheme cytochrome c family protein
MNGVKAIAFSNFFFIFYLVLFFSNQNQPANMKKFFVLAAICIALIATTYFSACNNNKSEPTATDNRDSIKKVLERGEYIANNVALCIHCHSQADDTKFSGPVIPGTEGGGGYAFTPGHAVPGTVFGRNITPDAETGIGNWTDAEVLRAVTQGISKNGDTLFPLMPYYTYNHMPKEDLLSVIAYIRTLKPIKNKVQPRQLMAPISAFYNSAGLQPSIDDNKRPPETDKVAYGGYLTAFASCANCHTPMTPQGDDMTRKFAGGHTFDLGTYKVNGANLTSDTATGIGKWTEEMFLAKFIPYRDEKKYNFTAGKENTIMPLSMYAGMKDDDLKAIYAYMKTIAPITNKVEKYPK